MVQFFDTINFILSSRQVLLAAMTISFFCMIFLLVLTVRYAFKADSFKLPLFFLALFLIGALLDDAFYIANLLRQMIPLEGAKLAFTFFGRIDWAFFIIQYQALALFLNQLIEKNFVFKKYYAIHGGFNAIMTMAFLYLAFAKYSVPSSSAETIFFEIKLIQIAYAYLPILFLPLLFKIYTKMHRGEIPRILRHQLRYLIAFILPYLILETSNCSVSYLGFLLPLFSKYEYSVFTLATVLCAYAMYFCSKKILGLRFLNMRSDVKAKEEFNFLARFKDVLEQLGQATSMRELGHLTQTFFHLAFDVPLGRTKLYFRQMESGKQNSESGETRAKVERFIAMAESIGVMNELRASKILIHDDIEFSNFYLQSDIRDRAIMFLKSIKADIFMPIYERDTISAYIVIESNARQERLYTNKERDEMLVFTSYLSNIINLLKYGNFELIERERKELSEELFHKHQQNEQSQEAMRSFIRTSQERKIGIVFYKHRRYTLANEAAQELIGFDLNTQLARIFHEQSI